MNTDEIREDIKNCHDIRDYHGIAEIAHTLCDELDKAREENRKLLETFSHVHINNGKDDICLKCGLDLRDPVHRRTE